MAQIKPQENAMSASGVTTEQLNVIGVSSNLMKRKREEDDDHYKEIALTNDHVVVVCRDQTFQNLAELALEEVMQNNTLEYDKPCKMGKIEYKRPRGTAFYAIPKIGGYKYGGVQDVAHNINDYTAVFDLLTHANQYAGSDKFTGVLLNFCRCGNDCIRLHSDKDVSKNEFLGVLSISLGITRKLRFENKSDKKKVDVDKKHGTILAMCGKGFQEAHKHEMKRLKIKPGVESTWHASFTFRRHSRSLKK